MERYLTINEGQIAGLLGAAEPELRTAILLASAAGLRTAEIRELKWADVDFDRGVLIVWRHSRNLTRTCREIPIHPILGKQLRRWREQEPPRETVFSGPEVQERLRYKLQGLRGHFVGGDIRFHDLRAWVLRKMRDASIELWTPRNGHRSIDSRPSIEETRAILLKAWQLIAEW
jgi:integrase